MHGIVGHAWRCGASLVLIDACTDMYVYVSEHLPLMAFTCNMTLILKAQYGSQFSNKQQCNYMNAKQKHLGCKKVRGQSEATCKQAGTTKRFDIS